MIYKDNFNTLKRSKALRNLWKSKLWKKITSHKSPCYKMKSQNSKQPILIKTLNSKINFNKIEILKTGIKNK